MKSIAYHFCSNIIEDQSSMKCTAYHFCGNVKPK